MIHFILRRPWPQFTESFFTRVQSEDRKVLQKKKQRKKVWIKRRGNGFHCTNVGGITMSVGGTEELCSVLAGRRVKRAAAPAGRIYSDKSSYTLKSQTSICLRRFDIITRTFWRCEIKKKEIGMFPGALTVLETWLQFRFHRKARGSADKSAEDAESQSGPVFFNSDLCKEFGRLSQGGQHPAYIFKESF